MNSTTRSTYLSTLRTFRIYLGVLLLLALALGVLHYFYADVREGRVYWFDLDKERNVPTWFSGLLLLFLACASSVAFYWEGKLNREHARMTTLEKNQRLNLLDGPLYAASFTQFATLRYRSLVVAVARRRATLVAVALGAYRHDHGSYPISLDELVGRYLEAVPVDPFDGLPIRYRALPDTDDYLLYCVGRGCLQSRNCMRK